MNDCCNDFASFGGQNVSPGTWYFSNDPMSPEHAQAIRNARGEVPLGFPSWLTREENIPDIPVAEPIQVELPAADRSQQRTVFLRPRAQSSDPLTLPLGRAANRLNDLSQRAIHPDRSQRIQVSLVAGLRDLGSAVQIRHPLAHWLPATGPTRNLPRCPVDLEITGMVHGGLDAQYAALLVVHLDRVPVDGMLQPDPFGALPIMTDHFSLKIPVESFAQKTHDIL